MRAPIRHAIPAWTLAIVIGAALLLASTAQAEESTEITEAAKLSIADLELRVKPMRKAELEKEAEAWAAVLQQQVAEVSRLETELRSTEGAAQDAKLAEIQAASSVRSALIERVKVVLDAWSEKGGDPTELNTYVKVVGGMRLDFTDAGATTKKIWAWLKSPDGGVAIGKNILYFLVILIAFKILANILASILSKSLTKFRKTPELLRKFLVNTVRKVTFFVGLVIALSALGVEIGPLLAAMGAAGFIVAFALQDTLGNLANGVMILLNRPFDIGDVVTVAGVTGKVEAMSLVSATVKTADNQVLVVPNKSIWGSVITNITGSETRRVDMVFGIGYDDDIAQAQRVLEHIVSNHELVLKDPAPVVNVATLGASSVDFNVRPWTKTGDYWTVYWDITRTVKERFDAEGISIPYPQQDIHVHQVAPATA